MQNTEKLHPKALGIDEKSGLEILTILYEGQLEAAKCVIEAKASLEVGARAMADAIEAGNKLVYVCLLYTSPSPRDRQKSRMPSSA